MFSAPLAWVRLAAGVVVLGALIWLGVIVNSWHEASLRLAVVELERDQALADLSLRDTQYLEAQEASNGYQSELQALRVTASRARVPIARLCPRPAAADRRSISSAGTGSDAAPAAAGGVPTEDEVRRGRDIGPELFELADRADELSAQVRGLQAYARACSAAPDEIDPAPIVTPDMRTPRSPNPWDGMNEIPKRPA